jgi:hypothetical protein
MGSSYGEKVKGEQKTTDTNYPISAIDCFFDLRNTNCSVLSLSFFICEMWID